MEPAMEQRKNQRFDLRLPFELVGGPDALLRGETKNVSSCGVLFAADSPVVVGDPIEYLITLPKAKGARINVRLRCIGKVVRGDQGSEFAATLERYEFVRERG
jgi:PilZ domain-containing protein